MREILFRGKRIDNGEWVEGYYMKQDDKALIVNTSKGSLGFGVQVDPETVGQYVGFKDNDDMWIFEGDILEVRVPSNVRSLTYRQRFVITDIRSFQTYLIFMGRVKIIGNIHDNPELLEGKDA
jgi:uncharacterized phage protein (TIGR01671 family)